MKITVNAWCYNGNNSTHGHHDIEITEDDIKMIAARNDNLLVVDVDWSAVNVSVSVYSVSL